MNTDAMRDEMVSRLESELEFVEKRLEQSLEEEKQLKGDIINFRAEGKDTACWEQILARRQEVTRQYRESLPVLKTDIERWKKVRIISPIPE